MSYEKTRTRRPGPPGPRRGRTAWPQPQALGAATPEIKVPVRCTTTQAFVFSLSSHLAGLLSGAGHRGRLEKCGAINPDDLVSRRAPGQGVGLNRLEALWLKVHHDFVSFRSRCCDRSRHRQKGSGSSQVQSRTADGRGQGQAKKQAKHPVPVPFLLPPCRAQGSVGCPLFDGCFKKGTSHTPGPNLFSARTLPLPVHGGLWVLVSLFLLTEMHGACHSAQKIRQRVCNEVRKACKPWIPHCDKEIPRPPSHPPRTRRYRGPLERPLTIFQLFRKNAKPGSPDKHLPGGCTLRPKAAAMPPQPERHCVNRSSDG